MKKDFMFTCESVTEGHPDKLCDQISDAIVDRYLHQDPGARVVAECAVSNGILFVAVRHASCATVDIPETARQVIAQVGYDREDFDARNCTIMSSITEIQDPPSHEGDGRLLTEAQIERIPARNMSNAFGYACGHCAAGIPLPLRLAHKLARRLVTVRLEKLLPYLAPDGKTQVGVEFHNRMPSRIHSITVVASQYEGTDIAPQRLQRELEEAVIREAFADEELGLDRDTEIFVNPEGPFMVGGPSRHSGLTGRKTAIDTYGEFSRHSESALSGKDPSRIDRVGVYAARHAAKNVVAARLARECEVHLTYSIGRARPASIQVETFGSGGMPDDEIAALVAEVFDFRPAGIVRQFNLRNLPALGHGSFYRRLAAYGHVGRVDLAVPWEATDKAAALAERAGLAVV
jgi:S-adenosylmethionine synthetase